MRNNDRVEGGGHGHARSPRQPGQPARAGGLAGRSRIGSASSSGAGYLKNLCDKLGDRPTDRA
jgi:hypothetical protein